MEKNPKISTQNLNYSMQIMIQYGSKWMNTKKKSFKTVT